MKAGRPVSRSDAIRRARASLPQGQGETAKHKGEVSVSKTRLTRRLTAERDSAVMAGVVAAITSGLFGLSGLVLEKIIDDDEWFTCVEQRQAVVELLDSDGLEWIPLQQSDPVQAACDLNGFVDAQLDEQP